MTEREDRIGELYEGLTFVARQGRELGSQLHPELSLVAQTLLSFVASEPEPRASDIASAYGLDKSTVSRQLAQLEALGLIVRAERRPGRRGQPLELTQAGRRLLQRADRSSRETLAAHLSTWRDEDIEALAGLLTRFARTSRQARRAEGTAP